MASGWKSEDQGFEPKNFDQLLSPDCLKNNSLPRYTFNEKNLHDVVGTLIVWGVIETPMKFFGKREINLN